VANSHLSKEEQPDALCASTKNPTLPPTFIQPSVGAAITRDISNHKEISAVPTQVSKQTVKG